MYIAFPQQQWFRERASILRYAYIACLVTCLVCGSHNKQRLFLYTALTDWFYNRDGVCLLRGTFCPHNVFMCFVWIWEQTAIISLYSINWLVFITETECFLRGTFCPHFVFKCFVWIWEQTAIISLYSINWLVFTRERECVYCAVRSAHTLYLCVLCGSKNKQRLFHCTALTDWFL
jgi:hypothetical protein